MEKANQTLNNAIFNTSSWIITSIISFIFLPYIVNKLGTEAYGLYVLVFAIIGYFAILDLNLGYAVIKYVAEYNVQDNIRKVNEIVGVTIALYLIIGLSGGLLIFILSNFVVQNFFKISDHFKNVAYFAFNLGSLGFLLTMLLSVISAIPNGLNRYDITSKVSIIMSFITMIGTVLLLALNFRLKAIIVMNLVVTLSSILIYIKISKKLLPGLQIKPSFSKWALKKVLKFGLYSMLSRLSGVLQFQADRILTGAILGVNWITYYVVPFTLIKKAMTITARLGLVIFPVVSSLQGKKDYKNIITLYFKSSRLIITIATSICLPLLFFGNKFLGLWMGSPFQEAAGKVIVVITISLYLDAFTNIPSIIVDGLGLPKITGIFAFSNAAINLICLYPLAKLFGINGVAISFLLSHVFIAPLFLYYVNNRVLKLTFIELFKNSFRLPFFAALLILIPLFFIPTEEIKNIFFLIFIMMATTIMYLIICLNVGVFTNDEKRQFSIYLKNALKKIRLLRVKKLKRI